MLRPTAHNPRYVKLIASAVLGLGVVAPALALPVAPAHAEAPASYTGLAVGASGDAVRQVQQALIDRGYAVAGGADGVFGSATKTALQAFQKAQGLNASGSVTPATALALGLTSNALLGLTAGSTGDAVRQLQQNLIDRGIAVAGGADGVFGAGTTDAVKEFQRRMGYYQSGTVNAATAVALQSSGAGSAAPAVAPADPAPTAATADTGADRGESSAAAPGQLNLVGLAVGATGPAVEELQQLLGSAGVEVLGGADGVFGVKTQAAVTSFQSARGLPSTGSVDQATVDALRGTSAPAAAPQGLTNANAGATSIVGLAFGATGEGVKTVQSALMKAGYTVRGGADGVFGNSTQSALKSFQGSNGFEQTGTVTEATARALQSVLGTTATDATTSSLVGLKAGAVGQDVKKLQEALIAAGVELRGGADGIFGPATSNALKQFQGGQGLPATGEVDQATATALASPQPASTGAATTGAAGYAEYGEKGARVIALQTALVKAGVALGGGVDGDFGAKTTKAVADFQTMKGLPVTGKVDQATATALGLAATPAPLVTPPGNVTISAFPTGQPCGFADTWHFDRGGGRQHLGVDVIAPSGTPIYAVTDGKIGKVYVDAPGSLSGNGVRLVQPDGTYFFYAHMTQLAEGIALGVPVAAGQLLGYVGNTGNTGGTNHLHFEVHPQGGSAINPYSIIKALSPC